MVPGIVGGKQAIRMLRVAPCLLCGRCGKSQCNGQIGEGAAAKSTGSEMYSAPAGTVTSPLPEKLNALSLPRSIRAA